MRILLGIGNPGRKYTNNRHNVGFQFLDYYSGKKSLTFRASEYDFYYAEGELDSNPFLLVKPLTYVNNSGLAVLSVLEKYKVKLADLLVIIDDVHIPFGSVRIRRSGGDGGHNGMRSIIYHLNSNDFPRLRLGIGKEVDTDNLPDFVLSDFNKDEINKMKNIFDVCSLFIDDFIKDGFHKMLNSYSRSSNLEK